MQNNKRQIVFIDQDEEFHKKIKDLSPMVQHDIISLFGIDQLFPLLTSDGRMIDVIAINIDPYPIDQLMKIRKEINRQTLNHIKILSITSPFSKFSGSTVGKIKQLNPIDLIDKSHDSRKTLFRITQAIFADNPKRKNKRAHVDFKVRCEMDGTSFEASSFSLSRDGIFLKTDRSLNKEKQLTISFNLPGDTSSFRVKCKYLYELSDDTRLYRTSPKGIGLLFLDTSEEEKQKLDKYVKENL